MDEQEVWTLAEIQYDRLNSGLLTPLFAACYKAIWISDRGYYAVGYMTIDGGTT